jgi:hypothetical protein
MELIEEEDEKEMGDDVDDDGDLIDSWDSAFRHYELVRPFRPLRTFRDQCRVVTT